MSHDDYNDMLYVGYIFISYKFGNTILGVVLTSAWRRVRLSSPWAWCLWKCILQDFWGSEVFIDHTARNLLSIDAMGIDALGLLSSCIRTYLILMVVLRTSRVEDPELLACNHELLA